MEFKPEKVENKRPTKQNSKNSTAKKLITITKTVPVLFVEVPFEAIESRRSSKKKMLAAAKNLQDSGGKKQDRVQVEDNNLESSNSHNKCNKKKSQSHYNRGIETAMLKEQTKVQAAAKKRDKMWGWIAKAMDTAMVKESPGKI